MTITIKTDNKWRNLLSWYELTEKEKAEFDWLENDNGEDFFRYKGAVYCVSEAMRLDNTPPWQGYYGESWFSAVVIQLSRDGERVKIGLALS